METILRNNEKVKEDKRGKNPRSLANLEKGKWKKGQTGNPKGHPLGQPNYETLRRLAIIKLAKDNGKKPEEIDVEIMANALLEARKGNFSFYKDDKDRTFGNRMDINLNAKDIKEVIESTKLIANG